MSYTETNPLNKHKALSEIKRDSDFNLYLVEVGTFTQGDTNTPTETQHVLVATEEMEDAVGIATDVCERELGLADGEYFSQINEIEIADIADYQPHS